MRERLGQEVLGITLADNTHAALLRRDGLYQRSSPAGGESRRCQEEFIRLAERAARLGGSRKGKKDDFPQVKLRPGPFEVTSASGRARRHP